MYAYPDDEKDTLDMYDEPRLHMERLMKARLVEFDLSLRILIPLEKAGIRTLGDLTSLTVRQLKKVNRINTTAIDTLTRFLDSYGLSLTE